MCSSGNLSACDVGEMSIENQLERNYRKISSVAFRQSWSSVIFSSDIITRLIIFAPLKFKYLDPQSVNLG